MRRPLVALAAAVAVFASGCGDSPTPGAASGHYSGRGDGLGGSIDFHADEPMTDRIRELVKGRRLRVAVAYVVNHSDRPQLMPTFTAERYDGRIVVLSRADKDPQIARIGLTAPLVVSPDGAATLYLLTTERPEGLTTIVMRRADGKRITLNPQPVD